MNPVTAAVLKAGIVSQEMLNEMRRFSPTLGPDATAAEVPVDLETAARLVEEALGSAQYVLMRETDLEVIRQYVETAQGGTLHVVDEDETTSADIPVTFGRTPIGEYIIAWKSESIADVMTNGATYLVDGDAQVYFQDVRELFFGEQKAFMVCAPVGFHEPTN